MSKQTKAALDTALAEHIASINDGAMLTGYIIQTSAMPLEAEDTNNTKYNSFGMDGQPFHVGLGLVHFLLKYHQPEEGGM